MSGEDEDTTSSPFLFRDIVFKWLESALDYGFTEFDFWNMTIAELERAVESKKRIYIAESKEKAVMNYTLADLIGKSVARIYNSTNTMPPIEEVYPTLFDSAEIKEQKAQKQAELSALRFKQFANSFNKNFKAKEAKDNLDE